MTKQGIKPKTQYPACFVSHEIKKGYCGVCSQNWKCSNKRRPNPYPLQLERDRDLKCYQANILVEHLSERIKELEGQLLGIKNDPSIGKLVVEVSENEEMEN